MRTEVIDKLEANHTHFYGGSWAFDADKHWKKCDCGEKTDAANHIEDGGTVTKKPTVEETGIKTYKCAVLRCGLRR